MRDTRSVPVVPGDFHSFSAPRGTVYRAEATPGEVAAPFAVLAGLLFMVAGGMEWAAALLISGAAGALLGLWVVLMWAV